MTPHTHSLRDLEAIDTSTLVGRSELRLRLVEDFKVAPALADWVIQVVEESNEKLREEREPNRTKQMDIIQ